MKAALQSETPVARTIGSSEVVVDLDPRHRVLRITLPSAVTDKACREIYRTVARLASQGGPYAAVADLSRLVDFPVSCNMVRDLAANQTAIPGGRVRVIVASQPAVFGLSRMFELSRDSMDGQLQVVHCMDEAYELLKVGPRDFSRRLFPAD
jgi:hypothetical protein